MHKLSSSVVLYNYRSVTKHAEDVVIQVGWKQPYKYILTQNWGYDTALLSSLIRISILRLFQTRFAKRISNDITDASAVGSIVHLDLKFFQPFVTSPR